MGQDGRDIGGYEEFALPQADHHGGAEFGGDQGFRFAFVEDADRISAAQFGKRLSDGLFKVGLRLELLFHQVGDHLGVGFALEDVTGLFELFFQLQVVLDDAVMDHDDRSGLMRVGVDLGGPAVGRPAGVADTDRTGQGLLPQQVVQVDQLALAAANA